MSLVLIIIAAFSVGASVAFPDMLKRQQAAIPSEYSDFSQTTVGEAFFRGDRSSFYKLARRFQHINQTHGQEVLKSAVATYTTGYFYQLAAKGTCSAVGNYVYGEGIALGVCQPLDYPSSFLFEKLTVNANSSITVKMKIFSDFSCSLDKQAFTFTTPACETQNLTGYVTVYGYGTKPPKSFPLGVFLADYTDPYACNTGTGYSYFAWQEGESCDAEPEYYYGTDAKPPHNSSVDILGCYGTYVNSTTPAIVITVANYNNTNTCSSPAIVSNHTIPFCTSHSGYYTTVSCTNASSW